MAARTDRSQSPPTAGGIQRPGDQVEALERRPLGWEVAAGLDRPPVAGGQGLADCPPVAGGQGLADSMALMLHSTWQISMS
jgi:hypothetical protein